MSAVERDPKKFEKLRRPGEKWAATIYGNKTYKLYDTMEMLLNEVLAYESIRLFTNSTNRKAQGLIDNIQLIRFQGTGSRAGKEWHTIKNKDLAARVKYKKEKNEANAKMNRSERKLATKSKKLRESEAKVKALRAELKQLKQLKKGKK